jgi:hypothetical protein
VGPGRNLPGIKEMKRIIAAVASIWLGFGLSGCAATSYDIKVNGYTDPSIPQQILFGGSFFVIENKDAKNPLLEKEVQGKINKLLEKHGYQLAPYDRADYYLFFTYGIGQERSTTVVMPDYGWGFGVGSGFPCYRNSYFFVGPFISYYPYYPETYYDRFLLINVVDGKYYREKGEFRTLWVGEARSTGTSSDLRIVLNYLLLADFKEFGKNTQKAIGVEIPREAPDIYGISK